MLGCTRSYICSPRSSLRKQIVKGEKGKASFGGTWGQYLTVEALLYFFFVTPIPQVLPGEFFLPFSLFGSFVVSGRTELVGHGKQSSTYNLRFDPSFPSPGSHLSLACCQDPQVPSHSRIPKSWPQTFSIYVKLHGLDPLLQLDLAASLLRTPDPCYLLGGKVFA